VSGSHYLPLDVLALEAVRKVAQRYQLSTAQLKPCVCLLLEGHESSGSRHRVAFVLAIDLRRMGLTPEQVEVTLLDWAKRCSVRLSEVKGAVKSAFGKKSNGEWRYHPPGLHKTGAVYAELLKPICDELGCPANCPAFSGKYQGPVKETFERFEQLGWPAYLKKKRRRADVDLYGAICRREKQLRLAPGVELLISYRQVAELAEVHATTAGDSLRRLRELGLILFTACSGSGPHA
jgi:hypothetical protein